MTLERVDTTERSQLTDQRGDWMERLLRAIAAAGAERDLDENLQYLLEAAIELLDARYGALGVLDESGQGLSTLLRAGRHPYDDSEDVSAGSGLLESVLQNLGAVTVENLGGFARFPQSRFPVSSSLGAPMRVDGEVVGGLCVADKQGDAGFTEADEQILDALAVAGGLAVQTRRSAAVVATLQAELTRRGEREEELLTQERERIARDLHDTALQSLFACGLRIQNAKPHVPAGSDLEMDLSEAIEEIDQAMKEIRMTIFALGSQPLPLRQTYRSVVVDMAKRSADALGFEPRTSFLGRADDVMPEELQVHVLATLREALSNVAQHARARYVDIRVSVRVRLELAVLDDGRGIDVDAWQGGRGLADMRSRAQELGGICDIWSPPGGGTLVHWSVPIPKGIDTNEGLD